MKISYEQGQHTLEKLADADCVVKSPGIPDDAEVIKYLISKNIPVISEIEFGYQHTNANIIAITGSNGKTTVHT